MGGAVAVRVANRNVIPTLIGLAVIDVVEGEYDVTEKCEIVKLNKWYSDGNT